MNPADMNTIQGTYAVKPKLPAVPGNEGVGIVLEVGCEVTTLAPGEYVLPNIESMGTWRSHLLTHEDNLMKVNFISIVAFCMLRRIWFLLVN